MKITSKEIRQKYLDFYESKGHKVVPSSSLIPENDPTTLFTGSGMQPMVPYLLGEKHPSGTRIVDSQKSFRSGDIDEVGDNRHTTCFEMLGNWSLGDYFKKEQINWMFEFLTSELKLDPNKLYFSVYRGNKDIGVGKDDEAVKLWQDNLEKLGVEAKAVDMAEEKGMQDGRIFYYNDKENWWSRAGIPDNMPVGEPGGPDSEMFWDFGEKLGLHEKSEYKDKPCHPACDCGRFLEIGNNVFMQYIKTETGFEELKNKNIDFGGGLERLAIATIDKPDVFMIDIFDGPKKKLEEISGKKYGEDEKETKAFRVILDHLKAAMFLIGDGAIPSNKDQGYFTRRLIRRSIRFANDLGIDVNFTKDIVLMYIKEYSHHYKNLEIDKKTILSELEIEENQFKKTLKQGLKEFEKLLSSPQPSPTGEGDKRISISGEESFKLYDTYGFPIEMTLELAEERGLKVDIEGFDKAFLDHKKLSKAGGEKKFKGGLSDSSEATTALHSATHLLLAGLRKILSEEIHQKGSNITAERLRFDFNYPYKVERDLLDKIEDYVNEAISSGLKVVMTEMDKQEAMDSGVEGSFWEKYPDTVKVYTMTGSDGTIYSRELCGGPHVVDSSTMGKFKIKKEQSSSKGVRRIKAVFINE